MSADGYFASMPTAGGVAAKYGDRYEGRWTVLQLLRVLRGEAAWIRVEVPGVDEAEFAVGLVGSVEFHQVKRQRAEGTWTINALAAVLRGFQARLTDPAASCTFVSTELAKRLDELSDRARRAESAVEFEEAVARSQDLAQAAAQLTEVLAVDGLPELWPSLQRIMVDSVSEPQLVRLLRSECRQLVAASPEQVIAVLGDLLRDSVSKTLYAHEVWQHIKSQGWRRAELGRDEGTLAAIDNQNGRFRRRLDDLTIGDRALGNPHRQEVVYAATAPADMPRSWKRACMLMRMVS